MSRYLDPRSDDEIAQAIELAEEAAYNEEELFAYESYWKAVSSEKTLIKENLDKGIQIGKTQATYQIAKSMREKGMDLETIASITGLSKEEIGEL